MTRFEKRPLGQTGIEVSTVGLGTVQIGYNPRINYEQALAIVKAADEGGIRHSDTAPMYGFGRAEYSLGQALNDLGTKLRGPVARLLLSTSGK